MILLHAPGKVNYIQAKAYIPVRLLSFTQKVMQNLVAMNIRDETPWNVHYIYNNLPTNLGSPQKLQCIM
jgi:hypothetical protein